MALVNDQVEMDIDLQAYWRVIRRWLWLIMLAGLLAGGTAFSVSKWVVKPVYRASVWLLVQPRELSSSGYSQNFGDAQRVATTYVKILQSRSLTEDTLRALGFTESRIESANYPCELTVFLARDTQVIELDVESTDPQLAASFANTLVELFIVQTEQQQTTSFRELEVTLEEQIAGIEADLGTQQSRLVAETDTAKRGKIEVQITQLRESLSRTSSAYQSVRLAELQSTNVVSVVESARVTDTPVRPRVLMNALLAAVVGAMVAVGGVFLREYLDTSVHTAAEAEALAQAPVLGRILYDPQVTDENSDGVQNILVTQPLSFTAESYRVLRANLQFAAVDTPLTTLHITSAAPGEGKSSVTLNLALAWGVTGKRVVVVDADMRASRLAQYAGVEAKPGLSEALVDVNFEPDAYLQPMPGADNVWVLAPGKKPPNPAELVGSQRMGELLAVLQARFDVVLIDSPPVLVAADAALLAARAMGTLLVLEMGHTDRRAVFQAVEQLALSNVRLIGMVLNKVIADGTAGYSYYYYSDYYGGDHGSSNGSSAGKRWPWRKHKQSTREG